MCGEQHGYSLKTVIAAGSPPRVRGTGFTATVKEHTARITPACAGNRSASAVKEAEEKDHPRVCGEQLHPVGVGGYGLGSPPRVRGTAPLPFR